MKPEIWGQIALAVLILINSIFSEIRKRRMEAREEARQAEIAGNLKLSQRLVEEHASLLSTKLDTVHEELRANTDYNIAAIETANNVNQKIAAIAEVAAGHSPQRVEIVQPADHPIPVREVDGKV